MTLTTDTETRADQVRAVTELLKGETLTKAEIRQHIRALAGRMGISSMRAFEQLERTVWEELG